MKVICISGKARHGKDTTAQILKEKLERDGGKVLITHYADLLKFVCKNMFGWNGEKDEAGRRLLQHVGTDIVRSRDVNFWVDTTINLLKVFDGEWDYIIIPDCRFPNEIERLKEEQFDVLSVRVIRPDFESELTEEQKKHPSETSLDGYRFDYHIYNWSIDELNSAVKHLAKEVECWKY